MVCPRVQGETEPEWRAALDAATALADRHPDLLDGMSGSECMLVMEYVPGQGLFRNHIGLLRALAQLAPGPGEGTPC